jgi:uncharacterized protein (DUF169 family)
MNFTDSSRALTDLLSLENEPVAITFLEVDSPNGVAKFDHPMSEPTDDGRSGRVAAPCVFWTFGHHSTFDTAPADHGNCSVGLYTHGFVSAGEIVDKSDVGALLDVGWVTMEAFAEVAALEKKPTGVRYGPLAESQTSPDVVLLRVTPKQMMAINDAVDVEWSGKPQCQILPVAANTGVIAASMGCALSRARTGMGDDELTVAIPGSRIDELVDALQPVRLADKAVVGYATADLNRF